jgi:hypothetical protein
MTELAYVEIVSCLPSALSCSPSDMDQFSIGEWFDLCL